MPLRNIMLSTVALFGLSACDESVEEALYGEDNLAPVITVVSQPNSSVDSGETASVRITVRDPNDLPTSVSWSQPDGPSLDYVIDEDNRGISFVAPIIEETSTAVFTVSANDGTFTTTRNINIVIDANGAPVFTEQLSAVSQGPNTTFSLVPPAVTDEEGDEIEYDWAVVSGNSVSLVSVNNTSGLASFETSNPTENVTSTLAVRAYDIHDGSRRSTPTEQQVTLLIEANENAQITGTLADFVVESGEQVEVIPPAFSDREGDTITPRWTVVSGNALAVVSTGDDGVAQITASVVTEDVNNIIRFSVKDEFHNIENFQDIVVKVDQNDPPVIVGDISPINLASGSQATIQPPTVTDDEGDAITYDWRLLTGTSQSIDFNENTGSLFIQASEFESDTEFQIELTVTDEFHPEGVSASTTLTISGSSAPAVDVAFESNGLREITADGGDIVVLVATVTDSDTDFNDLEFSWESLGPDSVDFVERADRLSIELSVPIEEEAGRDVIEFTADDGTHTVSQTVVLSYNANLPPVIGTMPTGVTAEPNEEVFLTPPAGTVDPEGEELVYQWAQTFGPNVTFIDTNDEGIVSFFAPNLADDSYITVTLTVTDSLGLSATKTQRLLINGNGGPVVEPVEYSGVEGGEEFTISVVATDPEGDDLEYEWEQVFPASDPENAVVIGAVLGQPESIRFSTPKRESAFELTFSVSVSDGVNDPVVSTVIVSVLSFDFGFELIEAMSSNCFESTEVFEFSDANSAGSDFTAEFECELAAYGDARMLLAINSAPPLGLRSNIADYNQGAVNNAWSDGEAAAGDDPVTLVFAVDVGEDEDETAALAEELDNKIPNPVLSQRLRFSFVPSGSNSTYQSPTSPDIDELEKTDEYFLVWVPDTTLTTLSCDVYPVLDDGTVDRSEVVLVENFDKTVISTQAARFDMDTSANGNNYVEGEHVFDCYIGDSDSQRDERAFISNAARVYSRATGCVATVGGTTFNPRRCGTSASY